MPNATKTLYKGADEIIDRSFDFSDREEITVDGQKIVSAVVTEVLQGSGLTIGTPTVNVAGTIVTVQISGGAAGKEYNLVCLATTDAGKKISTLGILMILKG